MRESVIEFYALYERRRGGLLYLVQALVGAGLLVVARGAGSDRWWSAAWLLPLYLGYFAVRRPLWLRLYRRFGHIERDVDLGEARSMVVWSGVVWLVLAILNVRVSGVPEAARQPGWVWLTWLPVFGAVPLVWGRFPVDWPLTCWAVSVVIGLLDGQMKGRGGLVLAALLVLGLASWGILEHLQFRRKVG